MQKAHREKMKYIQAMADFVSDNLRNAYYMHKDVAKAIDSVFKGIDDIMLHMTLTKLDPEYADEAKVKLEDKVESLKEAAKSVRKAIHEEDNVSNFKLSKRNELVRNFSKVSKKYKVLVKGFERYEKISKG